MKDIDATSEYHNKIQHSLSMENLYQILQPLVLRSHSLESVSTMRINNAICVEIEQVYDRIFEECYSEGLNTQDIVSKINMYSNRYLNQKLDNIDISILFEIAKTEDEIVEIEKETMSVPIKEERMVDVIIEDVLFDDFVDLVEID